MASSRHSINVPASITGSKFTTYSRYALWLALAATANANRRHFRLSTTWVPHLAVNSLALLLPDLYALVSRWLPPVNRSEAARDRSWPALRVSFEQLVRDNPNYLYYVAPVTLAYLVSHPKFNIYRGEWGDLKFMGFGLDSIPHSTTAYALTHLVNDSIDITEQNVSAKAMIEPPLRWMAANKILVSGAVIAGLTLIYETSEYFVHHSELEARDYDVSKINMMWSVEDTVFDVLSNILGWIAAVLSFRFGNR